jgi:hypothetical protein
LSDPVKHMDIAEFRDLGFLQEANRLFFHPLGLALEITRPTEPGEPPAFISGVWDYRDDPEGIVYDAEYLNSAEAEAKMRSVGAERDRHDRARRELFGGVGYVAVQSVGGA